MKKKIIPVCLAAVMTVSCLFTVPAVESRQQKHSCETGG